MVPGGRAPATDTQVPPSTAPRLALTEAARWTLAVERAAAQGPARSPAEAGAGQAGLGPALAHAHASGRSPPPAAKLQALVVDVQQADAALEPDTDRGPLQHPAARMRSGVRGQRHPLSQPAVTLAPRSAGMRDLGHSPSGAHT